MVKERRISSTLYSDIALSPNSNRRNGGSLQAEGAELVRIRGIVGASQFFEIACHGYGVLDVAVREIEDTPTR